MKWYEYKAEVDDLHASEELKARLLAMQTAQTPAPRTLPQKGGVFPAQTGAGHCGLLWGGFSLLRRDRVFYPGHRDAGRLG